MSHQRLDDLLARQSLGASADAAGISHSGRASARIRTFRLQLRFGAQIHLDAQRFLDIDLQSSDVKQRRTRAHVHEEIEIDVLAIHPARRLKGREQVIARLTGQRSSGLT